MSSPLAAPATVFVSIVAAAISGVFLAYFLFRLALLLPERLRGLGARFVASLAMIVALAVVSNVLATRTEVCLACHASKKPVGGHSDLACVRCHADPGPSGALVFRLKETRMFVSSSLRVSPSGRSCLPETNCRGCHGRIYAAVVTAKGIRVRHVDFVDTVACRACHPEVGHRTRNRSVMELCGQCHGEDMLARACATCHTGAVVATVARTSFAAYRHDALWRTTHGLKASSNCYACHDVSDCRACHEHYPHGAGWPAAHGRAARGDEMACRRCHLVTACNDCHGIEMPHPEDWRAAHGSKARLGWRTRCSVCHTRESCLSCHDDKELKRTLGRDFR